MCRYSRFVRASTHAWRAASVGSLSDSPQPLGWGTPRGGRGASVSGVTDAPQVQLSPDAHERLKAELEDLKTRGRVEIARAIEAARMLGDLSENGDYHAAKDSQGKMEARIRQLEATLKNAVIVEATTDEVGAGSVVTIRYEGDDDTERYLIGSIEERREGLDVMSPSSPLGSALLGKRKGDVVEYEVPSGTRLKVEIVEITA
jgi:transcription elongation factor GreA